MAVLGLRFCARAFSSCGKRGPLFIAVRGPLAIAASLVAEHRLQTCRLSNCGSRAQPRRGMWDLPRPGLKPVSPALAGRFSTTAPPGKPLVIFLSLIWSNMTMQKYRKTKWTTLKQLKINLVSKESQISGSTFEELFLTDLLTRNILTKFSWLPLCGVT